MKFIIANWKANHDIVSAQNWFDQFTQAVRQGRVLNNNESAVVILAVPYHLLVPAAVFLEQLNSRLVHLAVQNICAGGAGAYTGEVAAENLVNLPIAAAILGHSERRRYFGETTKVVVQKAIQASQFGIQPIICVDEKTFAAQAQHFNPQDLSQLLVAYEPPSAISTSGGKVPQPAQVAQTIQQIKKTYQGAPVLYGGSVKADNVDGFLQIADGVLVGGASLKADSFVELLQQVG